MLADHRAARGPRPEAGAISLLSADSGRRYGEEDLALATELANRAALAADNAQLFREASESLALLDTLVGSAPVGVAFLDTELRYLRVNDRLAEINGIAPEAHVGRTASSCCPTSGRTSSRSSTGCSRPGSPRSTSRCAA